MLKYLFKYLFCLLLIIFSVHSKGQKNTNVSLAGIDNKIKSKDIPGAKLLYERALAANPNDANLNYNYGLFLISYTEEMQKAKQYIETALSLNPENTKIRYTYAILLRIFFNNKKEARNNYIIASKQKPSLITKEADKLFGISR